MATFSMFTVATKNNFEQPKTKENEIHRINASNQGTTLKTSLNMKNLIRRNVLLGLGSVYVSQNIISLPPALSVSLTDKAVGTMKKAEEMEFPLKLNEIVRVLVKRPAVNRTKKDKESANEILLLSNIEFDGEKYVKFDVFVNDKDKVPTATPADSEFAGSFAQMPHGRTDKKMMMMTSGVRFGLTELLEDIKAEDDEYILVTLVPRSGRDDVTVSEIKIELVPIV